MIKIFAFAGTVAELKTQLKKHKDFLEKEKGLPAATGKTQNSLARL